MKLEGVGTKVTAPRVRERLANLDIGRDFAPAPVLRTNLESEIRNGIKFIDERGIKP